MPFDLGFALSIVPKIVGALWTSILVALLSCVGASLLGFTLEIARRSNRVMRYAMRFLIDFIRSTDFRESCDTTLHRRSARPRGIV